MKVELGSTQILSPLVVSSSNQNGSQQQFHCKPRTPSYFRRQERRKLERQQALGNKENVVNSANDLEVEVETKSNIADKNVEEDHFTKSAEEVDSDVVHDLPSSTQSCQVESAAAVVLSESDSCVKYDSDVTADVALENTELHTHGKNLTEDVGNKCLKVADTKLPEMKPSQDETVWALVTIDCSLQPNLSAQDLKRVEGILTRHDHLRRNIVKIDFGQYHTNRSDDGFCHKLDLKLKVDTSGLWENARPYIWKFFGQEEWKYADGMLITFNRIHVKQ